MDLLLSILISCLAVRGFRYEVTVNGLERREAGLFLWLGLWLLFLWTAVRSLRDPDRRLKCCAALFGVIIALFQITGKTLATVTNFPWIWTGKRNLLNFLNLFFSYACVFYSPAYLIFGFLACQRRVRRDRVLRKFSWKRTLIFWALLLVFYLPWYLYSFPGILSPDSGWQVYDAITPKTLSDFNPAFVTLLIRAVMLPVVHFTGSNMIGVGVVTALQMLLLTFIFALCCERIGRILQNKVLFVPVFLWFALWPVNSIYAVTLWKDILFSGCMLGLCLCLDAASDDGEGFFAGRGKCLLLFLTMALLPLLRHNGIFVTGCMSVYLLFRFRSFRRKTALICGGALILFAGWKLLLLPSIMTSGTPSSEMLSVPMQQIVRVLKTHRSEVPDLLRDELTGYFTDPEIWEAYYDKTADPVKRLFDRKRFEEDPMRFFRMWLRLGKMFPVVYLEAFLHNNYGYWFPGTSWWIVWKGVDINKPVEGLAWSPILQPGIIRWVRQWVDASQWEKTPVLALLFKPGACWWVWVFCGIFTLYRNRRKALLFLPGLLVWLPILFSAVFCEFRYVYSLFTCAPLLMVSALILPVEEPAEVQPPNQS